jgi:hypothetical protein
VRSDRGSSSGLGPDWRLIVIRSVYAMFVPYATEEISEVGPKEQSEFDGSLYMEYLLP